MSQLISIPLWFLVLLVAFAVWSLLDRVLFPGFRWVLRKRVNRVIDEINTRLDIEIRPFQLTKRQVLIDRLAYDPKVLEAVREYAQARQVPTEAAQSKALFYAREIVPSFNVYIYFRLGYWMAKKVAKLLYRVRVGFYDEGKIAAIDSNSTVVFVMNHRSNMDYILVSFLAAERTALSYAVGEWARVWPLQSLIKSMGAFFVRRNSKNNLYRRVLERYISMATREGVCQAVFLEGGLSKDGLLRKPKLGFLDYMLRNYDRDTDRDIVFVPVGINYDRTLEDRSLLRGLDQTASKRSSGFIIKTTIGFAWRNLRLVMRSKWQRLGFATVYFGKPVSMHEYCATRNIALNKLDQAERFVHVESVANRLMERIQQVIPVLPIALIAEVLLDQSKICTGLDIKVKAMELIAAMAAKGAQIALPVRARDHILSMALDMLVLRHIVVETDDMYQIAPGQEQILQYYANSLRHWRTTERPKKAKQTTRKETVETC